jgi:hypothetical protein
MGKKYFSFPYILKKATPWLYEWLNVKFGKAAHEHDKFYGKWGATVLAGKVVHFSKKLEQKGFKRYNYFQADNRFFLKMVKQGWWFLPFALIIRFMFVFYGMFVWQWEKEYRNENI